MSDSTDFKKANFYKNNFYRWAHLIKELKGDITFLFKIPLLILPIKIRFRL